MNAEVERKSKPLTKDETKSLLLLIENENVITSKTTNASSNRLKTEAWQKITNSFNASSTMCPRTPVQLRLKWENLKKNARKRSTTIRMNRIKTGGGPEEYIPPDDILDRVTSLLGNTVSGFEVPFGGDRELEVEQSGENTLVSDKDTGNIMLSNFELDPMMPRNAVINCEVPTPEIRKRVTFTTTKTGKRKLQDGPKQKRDNAITEYYNLKKQCLEANLNNILLQNEKLKLELEMLKNK